MKFDERKGQSAIEYLTTYGWMLLVIAIVGGAIFTTVQNSSQIQSTSGLANADVRIDNFGVTSSGLELELRGAAQDQVENVNVTLFRDGNVAQTSPEPTIPVGQTETVTASNIVSSENTNTFTLQIEYDVGGLTGLTTNGTITDRMAIQ